MTPHQYNQFWITLMLGCFWCFAVFGLTIDSPALLPEAFVAFLLARAMDWWDWRITARRPIASSDPAPRSRP